MQTLYLELLKLKFRLLPQKAWEKQIGKYITNLGSEGP